MCRRGFHANWGLVMVVKRLECYWKLDEEEEEEERRWDGRVCGS